MKLIIQIPCLNEEEQLPSMLATLPRKVDGFDIVEWLDDDSVDVWIGTAGANEALMMLNTTAPPT